MTWYGSPASLRRRFSLLALAAGVLCGAAACDDPARTDPVAAVELTAPSTFLDVGQTLTLSVTLKDASGQALTGRRVSWSSSNQVVATVEEGVVTGRTPGKATITAAAGGKEARVEVTVEPPVSRVTVEPDSFFLVVGNTVKIQAPVADHLANALARILAVPRDAAGGVMLGHSLRFRSSDPAVATVSDSGEVRGVAPGRTTIEVVAGAAAGRLHLTVERPYTLTYLGTLPGLEHSQARAINELGQVAAVSWTGQSTSRRAFVWENGRVTPLNLLTGTEPGSQLEDAVAINELGQVAGLLRAGNTQSVFLWRNGQTVLAPFPGARGQVTDLNDRGEIVGFWMDDFCTRNCRGGGFLVRNGQLTHLSNYGLLRIHPNAVNEAGQITGVIFRAGAGTESGRAFFLESESAPITFLPTNEVASQGLDLDAQGRVYGGDLVSSGTIRAFRWSQGGAPAYLGALRGGTVSHARRANNRGVAVGDSNCPGCPSSVPVLYRDGMVVRVNDLFAAGDWSFEGVTDINDRGQIVGYGRHVRTGATGALLLTPPQ
ncbi:MAG TPA: Ig-like domain-containing protein [Longimicrobiaceae bacterium]|nr:Ig-like domain-containing protein [Longimicrobiaceae bacterium]